MASSPLKLVDSHVFTFINRDKENETPRSVGKERQSVRTRVPIAWPISSTIRCFYRLIEDSAVSIVIYVAKHVTLITGSNISNRRPRGPTPPCTPSACYPSAEWGLSPSHHSTPSNVYVEDDSDWVCESRLDITRELEWSNGYRENRSILVSPVGSIGLDPPLLEPALL
ncbi:hypothetical protein CRG98_018860 [Punica granatum]|uniref:Uncharacterized protein n=1 Tax=Punica granatum TaxID=22663 RepID=A0A2I0JY45_PUNGR|nr:hypothetical protein CRG98_018860 [Punica granatum]